MVMLPVPALAMGDIAAQISSSVNGEREVIESVQRGPLQTSSGAAVISD